MTTITPTQSVKIEDRITQIYSVGEKMHREAKGFETTLIT